jgi:hypothetical protein
MFRATLAILTISTALMLSAGASTALASTHNFLINETPVKENVEVEGGGGIFVEAPIKGVAMHVGCGEGLLSAGAANVLEEGGKFKSKIELKACGTDDVNAKGAEEDLSGCNVPNFTLEGSGELIEAGVASVSGVGAEKTFASIKIENVNTEASCTVSGTYTLTGTTLCDLPDYPVAGPGIAIGCNPLGAKEVKFIKEPVKLDLSLGMQGAKGQSGFSSN